LGVAFLITPAAMAACGDRSERAPPGPFLVEPPLRRSAILGRDALSAVLADERGGLGLTDVPGFLDDRRDLRVGQEVLEALLVPVEDHPDPVGLYWVAKDRRALGSVLARSRPS
jgi:hypothetical protein